MAKESVMGRGTGAGSTADDGSSGYGKYDGMASSRGSSDGDTKTGTGAGSTAYTGPKSPMKRRDAKSTAK
jgi:hypothetical protein